MVVAWPGNDEHSGPVPRNGDALRYRVLPRCRPQQRRPGL